MAEFIDPKLTPHFCSSANPTLPGSAPYAPGETPPPVPPGPLDRLIPAQDGLDNYSTAFNSVYGNIIVRFVARNNADGVPEVDIKWNGVSLDNIIIDTQGAESDLVLGFAAIKGGATGTHNLTITATAGSLGFAMLRIGDIYTMDDNWLGEVVSAETSDALIDANMSPQSGDSNIVQLAAWKNANAYPITQYYGGNEQWSTKQEGVDLGIGAWFGEQESTGTQQYTYESFAYPQNDVGRALLVEVIGLVKVPPTP